MKKCLILIMVFIGLVVLSLVFNVSPAQAQDEDRYSGSIWTTRNDCGDVNQDVNQFQRGEEVWINGKNFPVGSYYWAITGQPGSDDPSTIVSDGNKTTESDGSFCFYAYTVQSDDGGTYTVDFGEKNDNYIVIRGDADFDYSIGACIWSVGAGSQRDVILTITGASVTITKVGGGSYEPFTSSQTVRLPAGDYTYVWIATAGYTGSGSGAFTVDPCPPASASAAPGSCEWDETAGSTTDVFVTVSNASLTLVGPGGIVGTYASTATVPDLPPGLYSYTWTALPGYSGSGTGSFSLLDCEPGKGDASIAIEACVWDESQGSTFVAHLAIYNATFSINGKQYFESQDIVLPTGYYEYSWWADDGFTGEGSGSIDVTGCEPASASVVLGACSWVEEMSLTPLTINVNGAFLFLYKEPENPGDPQENVGMFGPGVHTLTVTPGSYTYTWSFIEDYSGYGGGSFQTMDCEPGKSGVSISIGACTYADNQSLTLVNIIVNNAIITIDGQDFIEKAELKLAPGEYPYSWVPISEEFQGDGEGVLNIDSCKPKQDEEPDIAAGGEGPSLVITLAPALLSVLGLFLARVLTKHRIKKI